MQFLFSQCDLATTPSPPEEINRCNLVDLRLHSYGWFVSCIDPTDSLGTDHFRHNLSNDPTISTRLSCPWKRDNITVRSRPALHREISKNVLIPNFEITHKSRSSDRLLKKMYTLTLDLGNSCELCVMESHFSLPSNNIQHRKDKLFISVRILSWGFSLQKWNVEKCVSNLV